MVIPISKDIDRYIDKQTDLSLFLCEKERRKDEKVDTIQLEGTH